MIFKKLLAVSASLVVGTVLFTETAAAEIDMDYEGAVDIFTGQPVQDDDEISQQQIITLSDGSIYDRLTHTFNYSLSDNNGTVKSSVAGGMITTDSVSIEIDSDVTARLYINGEEAQNQNMSEISASGSYSLLVSEDGVDHQLFSFTIIPKKTGALTAYDLPDGFLLNSVILSGEPQLLSDRQKVDFSQDGDYKISYRCAATGIDYGLDITVDHIPPKVELEGTVDGAARGTVTLIGLDEYDSVSVIHDGREMKYPKDGIFTVPGEYVLTITDDAGNQTVEQFEIKFYLNYQGVFFGLISLAVIIAVIVFLYVSRKRLKVR